MALETGHKLGQYEIVEPIGKGGMGEVYRARDTKLHRDVAIKVLPEEFARDKQRLDRFEREARLLAQLSHANIATLHGLEEYDGQQFLVMELVEGETLAERMARGPIAVEEAVPLFQQIAEGLEAAHERGVIHRDLKPANIKISPEGKAKILDFGLAKGTLALEAGPDSPTITRHGTSTGLILGTAHYMSPEQSRGQSVDRRTDIWAFGCVLYESLAGRKAFEGATLADILASIVRAEPTWKLLPRDTPWKFRELLRRCLEKDPRRRLRDIGEAWVALDAPSSAPTSKKAGSGTTPTVVAGFAGIVLGGVIVWLVRPAAAPELPVRSVIPLESDDRLAIHNTASSLAISPDGRTIAYVVERGDSQHIQVRPLNETEGKPLDTAVDAHRPFFSPDGQWVGFVTSEGPTLMKVSVSGGAPQTIADEFAISADWGVGGDVIVSMRDGLGRVSSEGGTIERLTSVDREQRELGHRLPQWLPGGESVLFTIGTGDMDSWGDARIAVLSLTTGQYRVVLEGGTHARYCETGHLVYMRGRSLHAAPFDIRELAVTGPSVPVLDGVTSNPTGWGNADFSLSRSGSLVYAHGGSLDDRGRVWRVDRDGNADVLIDQPGVFHLPRISPDGRWVALRRRGANPSIWVYDLSRTTLSRLAHGFVNNYPIWTPDSRRITFYSSADGRIPGNIFWRTADGSLPAEQLLPHDYTANMLSPVSWSPDGRTLAFEQFGRETQYDIMLLRHENEGRSVSPFLQSEFNEDKPNLSPDGRWMAYVSDESGRYEVYVRPVAAASTGRWLVSTDGGDWPKWNPDGSELFYRNGNRLLVVDVETESGQLNVGKPSVLFETDLELDYDVALDGDHFLMADPRPMPPPVTQIHLIQNWSSELQRLVPTVN